MKVILVKTPFLSSLFFLAKDVAFSLGTLSILGIPSGGVSLFFWYHNLTEDVFISLPFQVDIPLFSDLTRVMGGSLLRPSTLTTRVQRTPAFLTPPQLSAPDGSFSAHSRSDPFLFL